MLPEIEKQITSRPAATYGCSSTLASSRDGACLLYTSATAAPTTEPQAVAATADSVLLHGVPDGATITINGQNAAVTVQNGDAALSKTALGDAAQLRVIANQGGRCV